MSSIYMIKDNNCCLDNKSSDVSCTVLFNWQLAGILLDTENLDFAARRDTEMATALLVGSGSLGRNGFYKLCTQSNYFEQLQHWCVFSHLLLIKKLPLLRAVHLQTWFVIGFSCVHCIFLLLTDVLFMLFFFWCAVSEVGGEARVSKLVTRMYGEAPQLSRK